MELDEAGGGLALRPRVASLAEPLESLHRLAERRGLPLVFTTCCSGRMPQPGVLPDVLFVPLDAAERQWEERLDGHRLFYLEKRAYGDPKVNFACRAFDMFQDNGNAARLVAALGVGEWAVFGNGFDLCVNSAVRGLLAARQSVWLLSEVCVPSARGYGDCGTPENVARITSELLQLGARTAALAQFLSRVAP
jgi:nicotinamidase-related amidase